MVFGQKKIPSVINCAVSPTLSAFPDCTFVSICRAFIQGGKKKKKRIFPSPNELLEQSACFSSLCEEK